MGFAVYPDQAPLSVGARETKDAGFDQHAGATLPGFDYAQMMFIKVAVICVDITLGESRCSAVG